MFSIQILSILALYLAYCFLKHPCIPSLPNATPRIPILGNALWFRRDPVQYLISQRARLGDIFLVDLGVIQVVFFLGLDGVNAVFKGMEKSGISLFAAMGYVFGKSFTNGNPP